MFCWLLFLNTDFMSKQTDGVSCGNADMPEFRKYIQLTVILARQIAQIEDSDDDITFLHEIYNFNEE